MQKKYIVRFTDEERVELQVATRLAAKNRLRRRPDLSFSRRACQVSAVVP
jgi:hypothetical protein